MGGIDPAEEALGNRLVAPFGGITTLEIAATHVDADDHVGWRRSYTVVDALDVEIDEFVGALTGG